jgi:antitoxin ParD1/3/4
MTVKSTVSFTDKHHQFAARKVEEGSFASVSSVIAAGIEQLIKEEGEREAILQAMKETIQRRMATPVEEWLELNDENNPFRDAEHYLSKRQP